MKNIFLIPFSIIYFLIVEIRNYFYDKGWFKKTKFDTPTLCVGNLSVGGTGKSPMMIYLIELLLNDKLATLSRGYGRQTKGFRWVNYHSKYVEVGDEPLMFFRRFKNKIVVAVGEKRVEALERIETDFAPNIVLLDDAFQHRALETDFNLLLTDFSNPYFSDHLLPYGQLREPKKSAKRANIIVVTKCPVEIKEETKKEFAQKLKLKPNQKLFFSFIHYSDMLLSGSSSISVSELNHKNVLLITGIAKGDDFRNKVMSSALSCTHIRYKDHYNFNKKSVQQILKKYKTMPGDKIILTTEKDFVRLLEFDDILPYLYYWPIKTMLHNQKEFDEIILNFAKESTKKKENKTAQIKV